MKGLNTIRICKLLSQKLLWFSTHEEARKRYHSVRTHQPGFFSFLFAPRRDEVNVEPKRSRDLNNCCRRVETRVQEPFLRRPRKVANKRRRKRKERSIDKCVFIRALLRACIILSFARSYFARYSERDLRARYEIFIIRSTFGLFVLT